MEIKMAQPLLFWKSPFLIMQMEWQSVDPNQTRSA